jgi:adenylate kinase family enzyme
MIIHISGPSGSGKSTLGNKLKEIFGNKIIVKDIDDLRQDFIKKYYGTKKWTIIDKIAYQKYINDYINHYNKKPIIFVGLNHMPWWHKEHYYNMHSTYNYYIKLDNEIIIKQKCIRIFKDYYDEFINDEKIIYELINNNKQFIKDTKLTIEQECDAKNIIKMNTKWNNDYKKQGYKILSREIILKEVSKKLNNIILF